MFSKRIFCCYIGIHWVHNLHNQIHSLYHHQIPHKSLPEWGEMLVVWFSLLY